MVAKSMQLLPDTYKVAHADIPCIAVFWLKFNFREDEVDF